MEPRVRRVLGAETWERTQRCCQGWSPWGSEAMTACPGLGDSRREGWLGAGKARRPVLDVVGSKSLWGVWVEWWLVVCVGQLDGASVPRYLIQHYSGVSARVSLDELPLELLD